MPRQEKPGLRFALPLALAAFYLMTMGVSSHSVNAQCNRPGFKLNFGHFANTANKIVTADFNADGKIDIAAAYYSGGKVAVYFGNGAGEFSAPAIYPVGSALFKLLTADINNDAKPDLILIFDTFTANRIVSVLLNNGSGAFAPAVDSTLPFDLNTIQVADFNGDGKGDLVYLTNDNGNSSLAVRFGDGLGHFPSASVYPAAAAYKFVIGDFSGDGKPDVGVYATNSTTSKLIMYLNDGSGGLVTGMEFMVNSSTNVSLARDLNGDGKADIVGYGFISGSGYAVVLLNNGSGGFNRTDYPLPFPIGGVRAGDFNGDGKLDLIGNGFNTFDKSLVLYGNGTGSLTPGESFSAAYGWNDGGDAADFNGDGKSDLVMAVGSGVRTFLRTCNDVSNTRRIDYDGDGLTDFAIWRPSTGVWNIIQSHDNSLRTQQWGGGSFGDVPVVGDYDGDGKSDLAVFRAPAGAWYVLRSSDNTFYGVQWGVSSDKPVPGDYDADGKTDVAVFRPSDGGWYILQSSNNAFSTFVFGTNGDKPVQADYDNDDKTDVAVFRPSNGYWYMLKSSDGSFGATQFGISTDKPAPADYDGDGKADIAVYRSGVAFYFINSWDGAVFGVPDSYYAGAHSAGDLPAPVRRADSFSAYIWRPVSNFFGTLSNNTSGQIGMSGDIPVVTPYVIE